MAKNTFPLVKPLPCPDCDPGSCLTPDKISIISSDDSIKVVKNIINGVTTFNIRVNSSSGGGTGALLTEDTDTIKLLGDGLNVALKALLKISENEGNLIQVVEDGLMITAPSLTETPNSKQDTESIIISLSGTSNRKIQANVRISQVTGNAISLQPDGLYVPQQNDDGGGGGSVTFSSTATIDIQGTGSLSQPYTATVKISSDGGNDVEVRGDGLYLSAKNRNHYSLEPGDFTGSSYVNTDLAGKGLTVWLMSVGRFIYESMGEINIFPSGGFEVLIAGFDPVTDKVEVFVKSDN